MEGQTGEFSCVSLVLVLDNSLSGLPGASLPGWIESLSFLHHSENFLLFIFIMIGGVGAWLGSVWTSCFRLRKRKQSVFCSYRYILTPYI